MALSLKTLLEKPAMYCVGPEYLFLACFFDGLNCATDDVLYEGLRYFLSSKYGDCANLHWVGAIPISLGEPYLTMYGDPASGKELLKKIAPILRKDFAEFFRSHRCFNPQTQCFEWTGTFSLHIEPENTEV